MLLFTRKLHCSQQFERSLHVESSDPTYIQHFKLVALVVFEI